MKTTIYRVQDHEGRGPYKPGVPVQWVDEDRDGSDQPPFFEEFGFGVVTLVGPGESCGCGFRTLDKLYQWFSPAELIKLFKMGYSIVSMEADRVIAESDNQLFFARSSPLRKNILYMPNNAFRHLAVL